MLLLVSKAERVRDYGAVETAIEAHLKDYAFDVVRRTVRAMPRRRGDQQKAALLELSKTEVEFAVWIDTAHEEVVLLRRESNAGDGPGEVRRRFGCIEGDLGECSDAIASVVFSAMSIWLAPPRDEVEGAPPSEPATDNELSPVGLSYAPWNTPRPIAFLRAGAGYGLLVFDGTVPASHGVLAEVSATFAGHLLVEVAADFLFRARSGSDATGGEFAVGRMDLVGRTGGVIPFERWSLGAAAGVAVDFFDVKELPAGFSLGEEADTRPGFDLCVEARIRIDRTWNVAVGGGLDVFGADMAFSGTSESGDREVLYRFGRIQGRFHLALEAGFGINSRR